MAARYVRSIRHISTSSAVGFGVTFVWLAMTLFIIAIGISHGMLYPAVRKANALAEELSRTEGPPPGAAGPPPQVVELEALGKRIGAAAGVLNLLVVVILYLMIWKPGV